MADKHQPFGPSFNRDMEALIAAIQTTPELFTNADVRANYAKAGIVFTETKIPDIQAPVVHETLEEDFDRVGLDD